MKPSSNLLFGCRLAFLTMTIFLNGGAHAADIIWTGASGGTWATGGNWQGGVAPTSSDVAQFTANTSRTINLVGARQVLGLATPDTVNNTNVHTILGGGTDSTLTIGSAGITHLRGGLTIGSGTAGQKVDVILADTQTWNSDRTAGSGTAQAIFIQNNVRLQSGLGARTLTLTGSNSGSFINGSITEEAGSTLSIVKEGSGVWSLMGPVLHTGTTTVNGGTLRLGAYGGDPTKISVATGSRLSFRVSDGTNGFTGAQIDDYVSKVNMAGGTAFAFDTSNAAGNAISTYDGTYTSSLGLRKTGANNLSLAGTIDTPGGFVVEGGGVILKSGSSLGGSTTVNGGSSIFVEDLSAIAGNIDVTGTAAIVARVGGDGLNAAEIGALRTHGSVTLQNTAYFGISTFYGDFSYDSVLPDTSTTRFTKAEANTLFLTAQNTYTGGTQITGGILSVSDIKNGGVASQIGRSGNVVNGIILAGGRLQYTGSGATTDRLFNLAASSAIESSGSGALVFNNSGSIAVGGDSRTLTLTGYNRDDNRMGVNIIGNSNNAVTNVVKNGYGKWILSGNNTHGGATIVRGGTLVLDYTGGKTPIATGSMVTVQNGTAHFQGSGVQTLGSLNMAETENGYGITRISGGMNLLADTLTSTGGSQRMSLIDLSGGANTLSYNAIVGNLSIGSGNLLMGNSQRANIIVRAQDGTYGFASVVPTDSGVPAGPGSIQKLTGQTVIAPGTFSNVNSDSGNYLFNAGSYTTGAALKFQTLTFDSSGGQIDVQFGSGHTLQSGGGGRGLLFSGGNDVNLTGSPGNIAQSSIWFHNYLDDSAQLNISIPLTGTFLMVGGTGFTNYTGAGLSTGDFVQNGGLFRVASAQNLSGGTMRINQGVFEIGANLAGGGAVDLARTTSNTILRGDAGFSAHGGDRSVSLGTEVTWGASNFLINTAGEDGDHAFLLSSTRSDSTIDFRSNINLNGKMRTIEVANGSADADARISGNLTGSGIASRLEKRGLGTLELTGTNSYSGVTWVNEGKLRVKGGGLTATTSIHVRGATLELADDNVIHNAADITLENGTLQSGGYAETMGRLTLVGDNTLDLVGLGNVIRMADSSGVTWSSTLSILNWDGSGSGGGPDQFFIGSDENGVTGSQLSNIFFVDPTVDGISYTGTFGSSILGTGEIVAVIPEPSAAALIFISSLGLMTRRRRSSKAGMMEQSIVS